MNPPASFQIGYRRARPLSVLVAAVGLTLAACAPGATESDTPLSSNGEGVMMASDVAMSVLAKHGIGVAPSTDGGLPADLASPPDLATSRDLANSPDLSSARDLAPTPSPDLAQSNGHRRCSWLFTNEPALNQQFIDNAAFYEAIHPVWFAMSSDSVSVRTIAGVDDAAFTAAARKNGVQLIPTVASLDDPNWTRAMMNSASNRAAHIKALVNVAVSHGYDGLDIDYEGLWNTTDRDPFNTFAAELSVAMHAAGKIVTVCVPGLSAPSKIWSYPDLSQSFDVLHVMAYDFHYVGSHAGPTSPLGWVQNVAGQVNATGRASKFRVGLPNYGVQPGSTCALSKCAKQCSTSVATSSTHMLSCSMGPSTVPERILNCGSLFFDDVTSLEPKLKAAHDAGFGGVAYWSLGDELPGFFDLLRKYY